MTLISSSGWNSGLGFIIQSIDREMPTLVGHSSLGASSLAVRARSRARCGSGQHGASSITSVLTEP